MTDEELRSELKNTIMKALVGRCIAVTTTMPWHRKFCRPHISKHSKPRPYLRGSHDPFNNALNDATEGEEALMVYKKFLEGKKLKE